MIVPATIGIEWQTIGDPSAMLRLRIDDKIVGEILERIVLPNKKPKPPRPMSVGPAE